MKKGDASAHMKQNHSPFTLVKAGNSRALRTHKMAYVAISIRPRRFGVVSLTLFDTCLAARATCHFITFRFSYFQIKKCNDLYQLDHSTKSVFPARIMISVIDLCTDVNASANFACILVYLNKFVFFICRVTTCSQIALYTYKFL